MKKSILYLLLLLNITLVVINTYCDDNLKIKNIEAWAVKIEEVLYNENNLENIFTLIPLDQPPSYEKLWFIKILIKGFKFEMQEAGIFSSETLKYEGEIKDIQKTVNGGIEIEI